MTFLLLFFFVTAECWTLSIHVHVTMTALLLGLIFIVFSTIVLESSHACICTLYISIMLELNNSVFANMCLIT